MEVAAVLTDLGDRLKNFGIFVVFLVAGERCPLSSSILLGTACVSLLKTFHSVQG